MRPAAPPRSEVGAAPAPVRIGRSDEPVQGLGPKLRGWCRRIVEPLQWDDVHQRLASHPTFAGCSRPEIRALRRGGDECIVPAGAELCHEDRIGYWFFAVQRGSVRLTRRGRTCASLGPGSHLGDIAILGFGPQPLTAIATVDTAVFVLGRKQLLDLTAASTSLQAGLFPEVPPDRFAAMVRELRRTGEAEWRKLPQGRRPGLDRNDALPATIRLFPTKSVAPSTDFAVHGAGPSSVQAAPGAGSRRPRPAVVASVVAVVLAATLAFGCGFHPDVLVVRPAAAIDITDDVRISGVPAVRAPTGRYLLTAVSLEQPTLFGAALAWLRDEQTVPRAEDPGGVRREGRRQYLESQRRAVEVVAGEAGVEAGSLDVTFRDRGLVGSSAGLVYALLVADMTGHLDAGGRTVAATGALGPGGPVLPVGFVGEKRAAAQRAGAAIFLVPEGRGAPGSGPRLVPVASYREALRALGPPG